MNARLLHRPRRHAFTLIELLTVIAIIMLLLAILMPGMSRALRTGDAARCASNMHQIHVALVAAATDGGGQSAIKPVGWIGVTAGYLKDGPETYVCPEDEEPGTDIGGGEYSFQTKQLNLFWGSLIPIAPGPRAKIISTVADGYVLGLEDWTDFDYNDLMIQVTTKNGMTTLKPISSSTAGDFNVVRLTTPPTVVWSLIKNKVGQEFSFSGGGAASYGMNAALTRDALTTPGRILMLDYESTVARVSGPSASDNWANWWDAGAGRYSFARHPGNRINVMGTAGGITAMTAQEIDPDVLSIRNKLWALPGEPD